MEFKNQYNYISYQNQEIKKEIEILKKLSMKSNAINALFSQILHKLKPALN